MRDKRYFKIIMAVFIISLMISIFFAPFEDKKNIAYDTLSYATSSDAGLSDAETLNYINKMGEMAAVGVIYGNADYKGKKAADNDTARKKIESTAQGDMDSRIENEIEIEEKINSMSREEKVAQLFIVSIDGIKGVRNTTTFDEDIKTKLKEFPVGGIILFGRNISSPEQLRSLNESLKKESEANTGLPLFISVDEEGGTVTRLASTDSFTDIKNVGDMADIGAKNDTKLAYDTGSYIAGYLKEYGFNLDFAPVADVYNNPKNTIIGNRAFGSDPDKVAQMVDEARKGFEDSGVNACIKHFPGHGNTENDTHKDMVISDRTLEELNKCELVPFRYEIERGVSMIMVAHISVPNVTGNNEPASLSPKLVQGLLRDELGYDGVVITDAMDMYAISKYYSQGDAAVMALKAGCDMILEVQECSEAYKAVLAAVESGEITEERLNVSVRRVLRLKLKNKERG